MSVASLEGSESAHDLELSQVPQAAFLIRANGHIEDANALAAELVGYPRAQIVGKPIDRMLSDLSCSHPVQAGDVVGTRFFPAASGICVLHSSGRELPASVLLCPHALGSMIAIVSPVRAGDHGGMRETDVAQLVHDLRSPLATIALEMSLLDEKLGLASHAQLRGAVDRVNHNVQFLDRMVQDLLDSYAIEAGQFAVRRKPTELRALLEQVANRVVATRDRRRVYVEGRSMITLSIDELRIERVVANLLQNALKYAPSRTGIVVRLEIRSNCARVSVIDAGPGMTRAEAAYVFDKFRRTSTARAHEGSGLGLYVSKQIIEAHGGRIGVDSVNGVGSRFFFELPTSGH